MAITQFYTFNMGGKGKPSVSVLKQSLRRKAKQSLDLEEPIATSSVSNITLQTSGGWFTSAYLLTVSKSLADRNSEYSTPVGQDS